MLLLDRAGKIVGTNEIFARLLGYSAAQLVGAGYERFRADLQGETFWKELIGRVERGEDWVGELCLKGGNGSRHWLQCLIHPELGEDGKVVRYLVVQRDFTRERDAERSLVESEARFRGAFERSGIGMAIVGADGNWLQANESLCRILGYSEGELLKKTFQELTHPEDLGPHLRLLEETLAGKRQGYQMEKRYFHAEGHVIWVRLTVSLVRDAAGEPVHFVSQVEDVTDKYLLQQRLGRMSQRLALATRASGIGIWDWDLEDGSMVWDPQMFTLYGLNPGEVEIGLEAWKQILHPEDRAPTVQAGEAALREKRDFDAEFRIVRGDGEVRHVRAIATTLCNREGRAVRMIGTNWDITANVRQQRELERLATEASEASRAKGRFLANVSHEIRTPLNGIIGLARELGRIEGAPEEARRYADVIHRSGESLLRLINEILDFSKVEAGRVELERTAFEPRRLLEEVRSLLGPRACAEGLSLEIEVDEAVPAWVWGDRAKIEQVLLNLAGNATKFTDEGGVSLRIFIGDGEPGAPRLLFSVADTGIGIDPASAESLFEEFNQGDRETARRYGGTGLGLAISKKLVELMGGSIGGRNRPGGGAEFWFALPLEPAGESERPVADEAPPEEDAKGGEFAGCRILLVEDNVTNQVVAQAILGRFGIKPSVVEDGVEAIAALRTARFDLVLMDVQMPRMSGIEAARLIRSGEAGSGNRDLPLIGVSAHAMDSDREKCLAAGMDAFVTKPIRAAELIGAIRRWAGKNRPPEAASEERAAAGAPDGEESEDFDEAALIERLGGDRPIARRVAVKVIEDIERHCQGIRDYFEQARGDLAFHLHSLKGVSANCECRRLRRLSGEMELLLERGGAVSVRRAIGDLEAARRTALERLRKFVGEEVGLL